MPTCPKCKTYFRTPEGEEMDHNCPKCGYYPEEEIEE
jgi:PHP family Zn ribbon phosphoesterase